MSEEIVRKLLEDEDEIDPKRYALNIDLSGASPEQLATFKRQAIGYIKWVSNDEGAAQGWKNDVRAIRKSSDFNQVAQFLAKYDTSGCEFLHMIGQGYF